MVPESHPATSGLPIYEAQKAASKQFMSSNAMEAMMGTWISEVGPSSDREVFFLSNLCVKGTVFGISPNYAKHRSAKLAVSSIC